MKYEFIQLQSHAHSVHRMCKVLGISSSGYYDWRSRPESNRAQENRLVISSIKYFHKASRGTYSSPRIHQDLLASGKTIGVNRVATINAFSRHTIQDG